MGAWATEPTENDDFPQLPLPEFQPSMVPRHEDGRLACPFAPFEDRLGVDEAAAALIQQLLVEGDQFSEVLSASLSCDGRATQAMVDCGLAAYREPLIAFTELGVRRLYNAIIPHSRQDVWIYHAGCYHAFVRTAEFPYESRCFKHFVWSTESKTISSSKCMDCQSTTNAPDIYQLYRCFTATDAGRRYAPPQWRALRGTPCRCPEAPTNETVMTSSGLLVSASALPPKRKADG